MHKIILSIRQLRGVGAFKVSTCLLIVFLMTLGVYVATMPLTSYALGNMNDKLLHVLVFFGFAMLMDLAITRKPSWFWKGVPLVFYGGMIEVLQSMTEFRSFELADIAADILGVFSYFLTKFLLKKRSVLINKLS
ncbi:MAG: Unknown protein [uncultured Thiotrichaceae bacterium]|uniref:VanZ-like domain-containing protein n=1 Tax=uncultured Thiotrichaceae bacterium TaxID=298394 RepID=A0A6S6SKS5_9GAMM|nr:MAG: Unknown protein [uncultured Thiotrichaceae bacterium]